jgi:hypothetical protein
MAANAKHKPRTALKGLHLAKILYTYSIRIEAKMQKKLTISIDADVYDGLRERIGPRRISRFLNDLARPHVTPKGLEAGYADMAAEEAREAEALQWSEALIGDVADEPR